MSDHQCHATCQAGTPRAGRRDAFTHRGGSLELPRPRLGGLSELPMPPPIVQRQPDTRLIGAIYHAGCRPQPQCRSRGHVFIFISICSPPCRVNTVTLTKWRPGQAVRGGGAVHQAPGNSVTGTTSLAAPAARQGPAGKAARVGRRTGAGGGETREKRAMKTIIITPRTLSTHDREITWETNAQIGNDTARQISE